MRRQRIIPRPIPKSVERSFYSNLLAMNRMRSKEIRKKIVPLIKQIVQSRVDGVVSGGLLKEFELAMEQLKSKWGSPAVKEHANQLAVFVVKSCVNSVEKQEEVASVQPLQLLDARGTRALKEGDNVFGKDDFRLLPEAKRTYNKGVGINLFLSSESLISAMKAQVATATSLITKIGSEELSVIQELVSQQINAGANYAQTLRALTSTLGMSKKRAKLISVDQTAKVYGGILKHQQQVAGFKMFRWKTSGDERVRAWHRKLAKAETPYGTGVYRWDKLPWDEKGKYQIFPTSEVRCRCYPIPVLDKNVSEKPLAQEVPVQNVKAKPQINLKVRKTPERLAAEERRRERLGVKHREKQAKENLRAMQAQARKKEKLKTVA